MDSGTLLQARSGRLADLPRGTVTFLFTDIAGSTALWERDRAAMREAVARQLAILHSLITAHRAVLFLDELPEFGATKLEGLRQPLEDRTVTLARAAGTLTFPANFTLIAAMNPCPYGYFGDPRGACSCAPGAIG